MRLLYLVHRIPFPPNKGDKVRSHHLLRHLAARHEVHLGSFIDDPEDEQHAEALRPWVKSQHLARLHPKRARLASLRGLLTGEALSLPYYRDAGLARWVRETVARERIEGVLVFSSTMATYVRGLGLPVWVDFVDMDSAKWRDYAPRHRWPLSWLYAREGRRLLAFEREVAAQARAAYFVTEAEVALFAHAAPEAIPKLRAAGNGVEADFFAPDATRASPFAPDEIPLVFTGAMDYWPNVDAVQWCVAEMLPALRQRWPGLRLHIVGRSPAPAVRALAGDAVHVTGTVPDVRPYLQHAAAVVAPLRLARGIQNKVLEAMAMARPVVAAASCVQAIDARPGEELLAADSAADYVAAVDGLLREPQRAAAIGAAARQRVLASYSWDARLRVMDTDLEAPR
jgi:sugar transferase (PEP-CTERM/EpsH1 system associated)